MYFWNSIKNSNKTFLITDDQEITYTQFNLLVDSYKYDFSKLKRSICIILMDNDAESVAAYVCCLQMNIVPLLINNDISDEDLKNITLKFKPSLIVNNKNVQIFHNYSFIYNTEVGLLLSTSGSTGSSKFVAISYSALQSNTDSICSYLSITELDRGFCSMPLSYSYGLSIINSHINKNASFVLTKSSPFEREFTNSFDAYNCTNISGVPFLHEVLLRTGFYKRNYSSLRFITQAGGNLKERFKKKILEYSSKSAIEFYVMYGQTEATARISYVPPNTLEKKISSIGIPIPSGKLFLSDDSEILYSGPNIMLGYVNCVDDINILEKKNVLNTGDIGYADEDGYFYITGRLKRYIKITGFRYSLDEIENTLTEELFCSILVDGVEDKLEVFSAGNVDSFKILNLLQNKFNIKSNYITCYCISDVPLTKNGKTDYKNLKKYIYEY